MKPSVDSHLLLGISSDQVVPFQDTIYLGVPTPSSTYQLGISKTVSDVFRGRTDVSSVLVLDTSKSINPFS